MNRSLRLAGFILAAGMLVGFNWDNVDVNKAADGGVKLFKATKGLSEAQEIRLGREVAANLAARYSLVNDPVKSRYLHLITHTLARHSERPQLSWHVAILQSAEINAYAAPGGYLFVTKGLLDTLQDESELAGVIAHEMTHVTHKHILTAIRKANLAGAGKDLAEAAGADMSAYASLSDFSIKMLSQGLSRKDELDADRSGTVLAAACGYDAAGLKRSVQRLNPTDKSNLLFARFQKTHPPVPERLAVIDKVLKKQAFGKGEQLAKRFHQNVVSTVQPAGGKS